VTRPLRGPDRPFSSADRALLRDLEVRAGLAVRTVADRTQAIIRARDAGLGGPPA
jgi:hypothetical protein